ncbi:hypothetical protein OG361_39605 [Streptomyces sp. NBC_00090]|uniref:hypothetical protein n=1 Tax=Streptomyces sp. NBC_00090 TaxID=2903619 RepID=UPI00324D3619
MHILDDPGLSPRVTTLLARARRGTAIPAECVRELAARAEAFAGDAAAVPPEAVEAMIRFEERYGGLWYPLLGSNGMEHGLDGGTLVHRGADGWSFSGIVDGDWTSTVDVLLDQRTAMTLAGRSRVINRSIRQRMESHAQLSLVRDRPHITLAVGMAPGRVPAVAGVGLPAVDVEATGPADRWWVGGGTAVHLELHKWWGDEDLWVARCFTERARDLPAAVDSVRRSVTGGMWREEEWCAVCAHSREPAQPCLGTP